MCNWRHLSRAPSASGQKEVAHWPSSSMTSMHKIHCLLLVNVSIHTIDLFIWDVIETTHTCIQTNTNRLNFEVILFVYLHVVVIVSCTQHTGLLIKLLKLHYFTTKNTSKLNSVVYSKRLPKPQSSWKQTPFSESLSYLSSNSNRLSDTSWPQSLLPLLHPWCWYALLFPTWTIWSVHCVLCPLCYVRQKVLLLVM